MLYAIPFAILLAAIFAGSLMRSATMADKQIEKVIDGWKEPTWKSGK